MKEITYKEALCEALSEEMMRDENVILMGQDIGLYGGNFQVTKDLVLKFGEQRVIDAPLSEAIIAGCATGAAMSGLRPVIESMFSDFVTLMMDNIVNQAAKIHYMSAGQIKVPMVVRLPVGCGTGAGAQHSQSLEAWMCHVPGLKVVFPSSPYEAKGLLKAAIRDDNPVIFCEHKLLYSTAGSVPEEEYIIPIGQANVIKKGASMSIITYGYSVQKCLIASMQLKAKGIDAEIIDLRTLYPLDEKTILDSVKKTGRVLIVHEASKTGGLGAEIAALIAEKAYAYLKAPVLRVAGQDIPIPFNKKLEQTCVPQIGDIKKEAERLMRR
jgi:pyruvate dehydrogenase E1 component beta subunit